MALSDFEPPNKPPLIHNQVFSIAENSSNGTHVGFVTASDPNFGDSLTCAITGGTGVGAFNVTWSNGRLSVANQSRLDFETSPSFTLNLRVTDSGGLSDSAIVTVNLIDEVYCTSRNENILPKGPK